MKKVFLFALAAVLTIGAATQNAAAQKFELGVRAGIASQGMEVKIPDLVDGKSKMGFHLAAVTRFRLIGIGSGIAGAGLFLQPEVVYTQSNIKGQLLADAGTSSKVKVQTVDVPVLLSLKVSVARIQAGPVFTLMNNFSSPSGNLELQPLRPAVGYVLGASVDLLGLTIDGRYHGDFGKTNFKSWEDTKSSFSGWSLGVGIMF